MRQLTELFFRWGQGFFSGFLFRNEEGEIKGWILPRYDEGGQIASFGVEIAEARDIYVSRSSLSGTAQLWVDVDPELEVEEIAIGRPGAVRWQGFEVATGDILPPVTAPYRTGLVRTVEQDTEILLPAWVGQPGPVSVELTQIEIVSGRVVAGSDVRVVETTGGDPAIIETTQAVVLPVHADGYHGSIGSLAFIKGWGRWELVSRDMADNKLFVNPIDEELQRQLRLPKLVSSHRWYFDTYEKRLTVYEDGE